MKRLKYKYSINSREILTKIVELINSIYCLPLLILIKVYGKEISATSISKETYLKTYY